MNHTILSLAAACAVLVCAVPAAAQFPPGATLLGIQPRAPRAPKPGPISGWQLPHVTMLARFVAAELGPDPEAPLETRTAVAAAALRYANYPSLRDSQWRFDADKVAKFRKNFPRLLTEGYDGKDGLSTRDLDWLSANGYAASVEAARAAFVDGEDPSRNAHLWSDMFEPGGPPELAFTRTAALPTARGPIVFYKVRGVEAKRPTYERNPSTGR